MLVVICFFTVPGCTGPITVPMNVFYGFTILIEFYFCFTGETFIEFAIVLELPPEIYYPDFYYCITFVAYKSLV